MARYSLLKAHYLGDRYFLAGASRAMEGIDDEALAAVAELAEEQHTRGRPLPRRRTRNRAHRTAVLHTSATAVDDRPLWSGFHAVPKDEQGRPAPPPKLPG
jgi:hypothetical protein